MPNNGHPFTRPVVPNTTRVKKQRMAGNLVIEGTGGGTHVSAKEAWDDLLRRSKAQQERNIRTQILPIS